MPDYIFKKMLRHFQAEKDTNIKISWDDDNNNNNRPD